MKSYREKIDGHKRQENIAAIVFVVCLAIALVWHWIAVIFALLPLLAYYYHKQRASALKRELERLKDANRLAVKNRMQTLTRKGGQK